MIKKNVGLFHEQKFITHLMYEGFFEFLKLNSQILEFHRESVMSDVCPSPYLNRYKLYRFWSGKVGKLRENVFVVGRIVQEDAENAVILDEGRRVEGSPANGRFPEFQ